MDRGAQAQSLRLNISPTVGRPRDKTESGVGVAEGVVGTFPVRMIIAGAEMGDAQGGGEGDRARHVGGRSAVTKRGRERRENPLRILAEHGSPQRGMLAEAAAPRPARRQRLGEIMQRALGVIALLAVGTTIMFFIYKVSCADGTPVAKNIRPGTEDEVDAFFEGRSISESQLVAFLDLGQLSSMPAK